MSRIAGVTGLSGADRCKRVAALGREVGHEGTPVVGAGLLESHVDLLVVVDEVEHARRAALGAGAFAEWDLLRTMAALPRWEAIAVPSLTAEERRAIRRAPRGAVDVAQGAVIRRAGPPVRQVLAVVTDTDWDRGLNVASRFAPVATRVLVLTQEPEDLAVVMEQAGEYGIGLVLALDDDVRLVGSPERWREMYFSVAGWLFREQVNEIYLEHGAGERPAPDGVG